MAELNPEEASKQLVKAIKKWNNMFAPLDEIKQLLEVPGIDVNLKDSNGLTPLMYASGKNTYTIAELLLTVPGINVNLQNNRGLSALMLSSLKGFSQMTKMLLQVPGINVNLQEQDGYTALMIASDKGHINVVKALLESPEINVNLQNKHGYTALHIASFISKNIEIIKLLLTFPGINVNLQDNNEDTVLILASGTNDINVVRMLLVEGADINIQSNEGKKAFNYSRTDAMRDLLSAPSATLMMGKVNRGIVDIPDDNKTNIIAFDDITDGETVVHIKQVGKDFFYRLESWKEFMFNHLAQNVHVPIQNPVNRQPVLSKQIDIFTAHIVPAVQNIPAVQNVPAVEPSPISGSKRPRPANLEGGTRRKRKTRKANKRKRSTRRRHRI